MNKLNFDKALSRASTLKANFRQTGSLKELGVVSRHERTRCLSNQFKVDGSD